MLIRKSHEKRYTAYIHPLKMQPSYKEYLWGGTRLKSEFGKTDAPDMTAESWELSGRTDGASRVAYGTFAGKTIAELGELDRNGFWGSECRGSEFPVLVKLIDAREDLSVQVHPSDRTALAGEQGKAEMWYIVDCEPHAFIYYGFSQNITEADFMTLAQNGGICSVLNRVSVAKGDVFYIMPGMIHAIGAGTIVAEVQQSSNTTFRVYDYERCGQDGLSRPLHLERAAQVLDYAPVIPHKCKANSGAMFDGFNMAEMFSCRYFRAFRINVLTSAELQCNGHSFQHLLCVEGGGLIRHEDETYPLMRGDSFFMPAALGKYRIEGKCRVLLSCL